MKESLRYVVILTLITSLSGLLLGVTERCTREPIEKQQAGQQLAALRAVLPPVDNAPDEDSVTLADGSARRTVYYRGRRQGRIVGVAFRVTSDKGYAGPIAIMIGVAPDGTLTGLEILQQNETPGLGNRIVASEFRDLFVGKKLNGYRWRVRKDGGDFDQISGATISSRAVVEGVAEGLERFRRHAGVILADSGERP